MTNEASPDKRDVLLYVTSWCGSCRSALRYLDEQGVDFRTIDIDEDDTAAETVMGLNRGNRSVPTIMVDGAHVLTEPTRSELAALFESSAPS
jgi:mycoredoxin